MATELFESIGRRGSRLKMRRRDTDGAQAPQGVHSTGHKFTIKISRTENDEVFTTHQARSRDRELLAPNNPLSPQLDDFAACQVTKEIAGRCRAIPAPRDACVVFNANPEFYFIFNEIENKFRTDESSIGEVAINFFHPK